MPLLAMPSINTIQLICFTFADGVHMAQLDNHVVPYFPFHCPDFFKASTALASEPLFQAETALGCGHGGAVAKCSNCVN